jgi:hypothetical protein
LLAVTGEEQGLYEKQGIWLKWPKLKNGREVAMANNDMIATACQAVRD